MILNQASKDFCSVGSNVQERTDKPRKSLMIISNAGSREISPSNELVYACQSTVGQARVVKIPSVAKHPCRVGVEILDKGIKDCTAPPYTWFLCTNDSKITPPSLYGLRVCQQ